MCWRAFFEYTKHVCIYIYTNNIYVYVYIYICVMSGIFTPFHKKLGPRMAKRLRSCLLDDSSY